MIIPYATWDNPGYHGTTSNMCLTEKRMRIASQFSMAGRVGLQEFASPAAAGIC